MSLKQLTFARSEKKDNKGSLKPLIGNKVMGGCSGMRAEQGLGDWDNVPKLPLQMANLLLSSMGYKTFKLKMEEKGFSLSSLLLL